MWTTLDYEITTVPELYMAYFSAVVGPILVADFNIWVPTSSAFRMLCSAYKYHIHEC